MTRYFYLLVLLFSSLFLNAQTISGVVKDSAGRPIEHAVIFHESSYSFTNANGEFSFKSSSSGPIVVSHSGFGEWTTVLSLKADTSLSIIMKTLAVNLEEVTILASSPGKERFGFISALDVSARPVKSSQDLLQFVPGLVIAQHAGGGKAEQIFLRGFDIDHGTDISLDFDGMPVNMVSHAHGQGYSDLHFIIPELIERIDFDKGSYNASYGDFTTAGYASFKSKNYLDQNFIKVEPGMFNTYRMVAGADVYSKTKGETFENFYTAGEYIFSDGYFDRPMGLNRVNVLSKYFRQTSRSTLVLSGSAFGSNWSASGQIPDRAVMAGTISRFGAISDPEGGRTDRKNFNASYNYHFNNRLSLLSQGYYINYNFKLFSNFTFFLRDSLNGDEILQKENRHITGGKSVLSYRPSCKFLPLIKFGASSRNDYVEDLGLFHTSKRENILDTVTSGDVRQANNAAFSEMNFLFFEKLTVAAGVRGDFFRFNFSGKVDSIRGNRKRIDFLVSPKVKVGYNITKSAIVFFDAGYGFHSNDSRTSLFRLEAATVPKSFGMDLGMLVKIGKSLVLQTALWSLDLENEFVYVGDEGVVETSGRTKRLGIDLSLRFRKKNISADFDINYAKGYYVGVEQGKNYIPLAPGLTSMGGLYYKHKRFGIGPRFRYLADRPANEENTLEATGYFLCDVTMDYTSRKMQYRLEVENILNSEWKEAQFETESRLRSEAAPVSEIHFTPGSPFFIRASVGFAF